MKKINLLLATLFFVLAASAQTTSDFENLTLGTDTFWTGSDLSGGFNSGHAYFQNHYDTSFGGYWGGSFIYTDKRDSTTPGLANEYSAITGAGFGDSKNYAIAYDDGNVKINLTQSGAGKTVEGFYVTNTTYAYLSMLHGDNFEHAFTHDSLDYFLLKITGWEKGRPVNDTVSFYLADYRSADSTQRYILKNWQWVNLLSLGNVDSLIFSLSGSETGSFGLNTPAYFAMDNLITSDHYAPIYITINYSQDTLINVLSNTADSAGGPYTVHILGNSIPGASMTVDSANKIWYIPQQGVNGADTVIYSICNNSHCDTAYIIINIEGLNGISKINTLLTKVYPNPFSNYFSVYHPAEVKAIHLYDMEGRLIYEITCNGEQITEIQSSNLPAGIYIVKVISETGVGIAKITKQ